MSSFENVFSYVRNSVEILDVVQQYVSLKRAGSYFKGLSPFKAEKTPSFTVSPAKKIFYCFSTHTGGDVIDFVARMERCSQWEAAKILIEKFKISIPEEMLAKHSPSEGQEKGTYRRACSAFMKWCMEALHKTSEALHYLKGRGFKESTLQAFQVGYCPHGERAVQAFISYAQEEDLLISDLLEAGIILSHHENTSYRKGMYHLPYEDRIIFPILDVMGNPLGFAGRVFRLGDARAKYYNTSTNAEFLKKKVLYGIDKARSSMHAKREIFLVEGYFDVLALWQAGYTNVVATMGTACTEEHLQILERHVDKVVAVYDSDTAGRNALMRMVKMFLSHLLDLEVVSLPESEDPASLVEKNISLEEYLQKRQKGIEFFISHILKGFSEVSMREKAEKLDEIILCILAMKDKVRQSVLLREVSLSANISSEVLLQACKQKFKALHASASHKSQGVEEKNESEEKEQYDLCSRLLLLYLEEGEECPYKEDIKLLVEYGGNHAHKKVIQVYEEHVKNRRKGDYLLFFDTLEESDKNNILALSLSCEDNKNMLPILIPLLRKKLWKRIVSDYKKKLIAASSKEDVEKVLAEFETLKQKIGQ